MREHERLVDAGFAGAGARLLEEPPASLAYHRTDQVLEILDGVHRFDKAHVVMLTEEALVEPATGAAILRALRRMEDLGVADVRAAAGGGIHSAERYLIRELGEDVGGRIHLGRSSADLSAVGVRIALRDRLCEVHQSLCMVQRAIVSLARAELHTLMPAYTHGQVAQPSTFAHWLAMLASMLARDCERIVDLLRRGDESPAGAAAICGSEFGLNRRRVCELLGFARPSDNTIDAVHSHDIEIEALAVLAVLAGDLCRFAEDLMLWSTAEFAFVELADKYCATSSILAQKKNPLLPQAIKAVGALATGTLMSSFLVNKEPTGQAIMDQGTAVRQPLWHVCALLLDALAEIPEMLSTLTIDRAAMARATWQSWAQATDVAGMLVREHGLPWRAAHQIVGILVRRCVEAGIGPDAVPANMVGDIAGEYTGAPVRVDAAELAEALDPERAVARRSLAGGPAPEAVSATLDRLESALSGSIAAVRRVRDRDDAGARDLEAAIDAILAAHAQR
jgi:argininosuccinate lyase